MNRFRLLYVAPTLLLLLVAVSSWIDGSRTLHHRDTLASHYPLKAAHAQLMADGAVLPLIDPYRSGGQPLLGNPNALPVYPTNLLYRAGSPLWALNAHFWIHLLAAPWALFLLGRAWGLSRPAAWAAGVIYTGSGYVLSLLNLYNLISGAVWTPILIAACVHAAKRKDLWPSPWPALAWALLILSGDPMTAVLGLGLGLLAWWIAGPKNLRRSAGSLSLSIGLGTLIAAPVWVEMLRILPMSYRGMSGFSMESSLVQSWDPRTVIEWLVPLFFGQFDYYFWGYAYFGNNLPLIYSLFPGVLALCLVLAAGLPGRRALRLEGLPDRARLWAWIGILGGLFLATGIHNPILRLLYDLPGMSLLRYPIKCWLPVAVGASFLAGLGFERFLSRKPMPTRLLGIATLVYLMIWGALLLLPGFVAAPLQALDESFTRSAEAFQYHRLQWTTSTFFIFLSCLILWLVARTSKRRNPEILGALLLIVHLGSQYVLLQPLLETDDASFYTEPSPPAADLADGAHLVHGGGTLELFGPRPNDILARLPGQEFFWLRRDDFRSMVHFAGVAQGHAYELSRSPEGLDSFFATTLSNITAELDDASRVRIAGAVGADVLLLNRRLDPSAGALLGEPRHYASNALDTWVYPIAASLPDLQLLGKTTPTGSLNEAVGRLVDPDFDPRQNAVLAAGRPQLDGPPGQVEVLHQSLERTVVSVQSENGGLLVSRRAWLPIYRAFVDGEATGLEKVNLYKSGVLVPPGRHEVEIATDRRPTYAAVVVSLLALLFLVGSAYRERRSGVPVDPVNPRTDTYPSDNRCR